MYPCVLKKTLITLLILQKEQQHGGNYNTWVSASCQSWWINPTDAPNLSNVQKQEIMNIYPFYTKLLTLSNNGIIRTYTELHFLSLFRCADCCWCHWKVSVCVCVCVCVCVVTRQQDSQLQQHLPDTHSSRPTAHVHALLTQPLHQLHTHITTPVKTHTHTDTHTHFQHTCTALSFLLNQYPLIIH